MTLRTEYVPLDSLRADPRNPRRHDSDSIAHSLARFGYIEPVIVDGRTGYLVAGHGRVETLREMQRSGQAAPDGVSVAGGAWFVAVTCGWSSTSDAEAGAALIALNRTTELGGWVDESLLALLHEIEDTTIEEMDLGDVETLRVRLAESETVAPPRAEPEQDRQVVHVTIRSGKAGALRKALADLPWVLGVKA